MATVRTRRVHQGVVIPNIGWRTYCTIGRALADRPALRLTYDRGLLEIMTTSPEHERYKHFLKRLVEAWVDEFAIPMACCGSMTFKRQRRLRGLEPDECFWIAHEALIRGKNLIDLRIDPPPDLVLEMDISHSSLDRMGIYSILGVPEVWRYSNQTLTFRARQPDGDYADAPASLALPPLTPADLMPFLARHGSMDEPRLVREFRIWIRQKFPGAGAPPPSP